MPDPKAPKAQPDPWEEAAAQYKASGAPADGGAPNEDWKVWQQGSAPQQTINTPGEMLSATGHMLGDLGKGALKGLGSTVANIGHGALNIAGGTTARLAKAFTPNTPENEQEARAIQSTLGKGFDKAHEYLEPTDKAQSIGKGGEQVGEFLVPAGAEKAAVARLGEYAPKLLPLIRTGVGALSAGTVNRAQGGTFTGGALTGGASGALSEGLRAVAPSAMKSALRVGSEGLEYDRNTGKSVLDHTTGIRPGTIAKQAQEKVGDWSKELDTMAANAPDADLTPIRAAHDTRIAQANYRNSPTEQKLLDRLKQPLDFEIQNGQTTNTPLPANISPHRLRAIKQGVGSEVGNFSPQNQALGAQYKKAIYGDIDREFNRAVPGSAELDQRMSSLIPAIRAGQKVENAAPMSQRVLHRIAAHTGAMAGGIGGAVTGYQQGGIPGAIAGGTAGLILPEVAVSPEVQATAARALYSPSTGRVMRSVATPAVRETLDWIRKQNTGTGGSR